MPEPTTPAHHDPTYYIFSGRRWAHCTCGWKSHRSARSAAGARLAFNNHLIDVAEATHVLIESANARPYCSCGMWTYVPDEDHPASPEAAFEAHVGGGE